MVGRNAFATLLLAVSVSVTEAVLSGLYIDNGVDQTVIQHAMTAADRRVVEQEILALLGLGARPRLAGARDRAAPAFLLDVYRRGRLDDERDQARPTRSSADADALSGDDQHAIRDSDLIITFQAKRHGVGALRHGHGRHVWLEVSGCPSHATLLAATLRLHQAAPVQPTEKPAEPADQTEQPTEKPAQSADILRADPSALYTVVAHRILSVDNDGRLQLERVSAVNTSAGSEGWLELNVTSAVSTWLASPADNKGFFITLHPHSQPERHARPEEVGLQEVTGGSGEGPEEGRTPFAVAFLRSGARLPAADVAARTKREARRWRTHNYSDNYLRNPLTDAAHWTTRSCEIQTLYVSFKDLEWQDWIIAPDGYGAFYCSGECNFPLNAHKNATNHAIVQTLVHLLNPTKVPKPSCAPIKLSPISVLYYTDDSNVILRKYKNMVVKSCGCH